jgi:alkanesulfonate monooxygenase SsuD/methylene tetrahydromethanopterin reductase-like flavin-dependent oxidoreductase (luciferase family)
MIKPWLFEFLPELGSPSTEPEPAAVAAHVARYLDLWVRDEALGFEGIFFSEHHFGRSYSPSPNLLIAALAQRTKTLRLGVMGIVLPYYHPARVVEEIGMLDHLTGGRLEIGTAIGVPQELGRLNITMAEARTQRRDRRGAGRSRCLPPRQVFFLFQSAPSAAGAAATLAGAMDHGRQRRVGTASGAPPDKNKHRFQCDVLDQTHLRRLPRGSRRNRLFTPAREYLALRRRVTVAPTSEQARIYAQGVTERLKNFVAEDERLTANVPDAPAPSGGFSLSDDEFITGTAKEAAHTIIEQCRTVGAGHFLTVLNWSAPIDEVAEAHELFGRDAIPLLRQAT